MKVHIITIILFIILLTALFFRLFGINWDGTCCMHPDERAIIMFTLPLAFPASLEEFLSPASTLNPHFFSYGNFPLYLLKSTAIFLSFFNPAFLTYEHINLVGRGISVFADLLTIIFIFLIARKIWNNFIGISAAFFYSMSVFAIQASHFFTVDTLLTIFITLTLLLLLKYYKKPSIKLSIAIAVGFGLSLATKVSALPLLLSILITLFLDIILVLIKNENKVMTIKQHIPLFIKRILLHVLLMLIFTSITFVIAQPYAIIDFSEFIKQNQQQAQMTEDAFVFPYTLQYVGIPRYIYQLQNVFLWGIGPVISLLSIFGLIKILIKIKGRITTERSEEIILLSFFIIYFGIVGNFAVGWMRYMLPLYPLFCIFAGVGTYTLYNWFKKNISTYANSFIFVLVLSIFIWPLSFIHIYTKPNTRVQATEWIHANIPPGSTLAVEHWDDLLPLSGGENYIIHSLPLYDPDTSEKWQAINQTLSNTDYIIIASNRLYVPLQKLTNCKHLPPGRCYPLTARYYHQLFSEMRGFTKVAEIAVYPTIPFLNIPIIDQGADEAFTVYDHPKILIYKNVTH